MGISQEYHGISTGKGTASGQKAMSGVQRSSPTTEPHALDQPISAPPARCSARAHPEALLSLSPLGATAPPANAVGFKSSSACAIAHYTLPTETHGLSSIPKGPVVAMSCDVLPRLNAGASGHNAYPFFRFR